MGLALSFFQDGFTASLRRSLMELKSKDRLGMITAFILTDIVDDSGTVDFIEFRKLVKVIEPDANEEHITRVFEMINTDDTEVEGQQVLDLREFIIGIEHSSEIQIDSHFFTLFSFEEFINKFPYDPSIPFW